MFLNINAATFIVTLFLALNIIISIYYRGSTKSIQEYALGRRKFATVAITTGIIATYFSGSTLYYASLYTFQPGILKLSMLITAVSFIIQSWILAPSIQKFLGKLSVADVMGSIYGNHIKIITAIGSIIFSLAISAMEMRLLYNLIQYIDYNILFIIAITIIMYLACVGVKAIMFTNMFHCFTIILLYAALFILLNDVTDLSTIVTIFTTNQIFNIKSSVNYTNQPIIEYWWLLALNALPVIRPLMFYKYLIVTNSWQVVNSFNALAIVVFAATLLLIIFSITLLPIDIKHTDHSNILIEIIKCCSDIELTNLMITVIAVITISTAISHTSIAAVTCLNDLCKPLGIFKHYSSKHELRIVRILIILCTIASSLISFICKELWNIGILGEHFYSPIIGAPLLVTILGFRSTSRVILTGMISGSISLLVLDWYNESVTELYHIVLAIIINFTAMMITHYGLKEPGRWENYKIVSTPYILCSKNNIINYIQALPSIWNRILTYTSNMLKHQHYCFYTSAFAILSLSIMSILSISSNSSENSQMINILLLFSFGFTTIFTIYQFLSSTPDSNKYLGLIWLIFIFFALILTNTALLIISKFHKILLLCFLVNLIVVGILVRWKVAVIMIIIGIVLAMEILNIFEPQISLIPPVDSGVIPAVLMVSSVLFMFIKMKQDEYIFEQKMRNKAENKIKNMNIRLSKKNEMLNHISHEVRAPLQGIKAGIDSIMTKYCNEYYDNEQWLGVIKRVERLCNYINNLLNLSKIQANKMIFNIQECNLKILLEEIVFDFNILQISKQHSININYPQQVSEMVYCDSCRITEVMFNLISNAIKYSKPGLILIKVYQDNQNIYVSVEDNGDGIPKDKLNTIFQPFEQCGSDRFRVDSTGIGLNLCKELITKHNGRIWAENQDHGGSKFCFSLPLCKYPKKYSSIKENKISAPIINKEISILIVDDDLITLNSIRLFTHITNYQITTANNGNEAINLVKNNPTLYQVILLDISLPDKNADIVLKEIQPILKQHNISVIIQSGYLNDDQSKQYLLSLGATAFITKPYSQTTLFSTIADVIR
ncbi:his Kinase A domain protein [Orientia chuto str. Dubai]|uniref:histidine kinase n=1 Tax=Orientia chuto str. Dubai TaxID=1359168 RepID=A0A0F3MJB9_9RICK|nr:hybrid sensor histidine kinase/response regulator [Candidatus Orientia mediorientalis]KJV55850.1 his Kinase A domain protein [Orientia chuto str. Dubai]